MTAKLRSVIEAPRWAGVPTFLKDLAHMNDLKLKMDVENHIIRQTVRFKLSGSDDNVIKAEKAIRKAMEDFNN